MSGHATQSGTWSRSTAKRRRRTRHSVRDGQCGERCEVAACSQRQSGAGSTGEWIERLANCVTAHPNDAEVRTHSCERLG